MDRRTALKYLGYGAAGLLVAPRLLADPYASLPATSRPGRPLRARGRVLVGGRARGGVAVSDGISVVRTAADGTYKLVTHARRPHVFVTLPADAAIPLNPTGTACFYRALDPARADQTADFALARREGGADHAFLLLADPQTRDEADLQQLHAQTVPDLLATKAALGDLDPFAVACGDIMFDNLEHFPGYERAMREAGLPAFQVVGNHDCDTGAGTDAASIDTFSHRFGPAYYSFERGEVHYVVLDDIFWFGSYLGYLDQDQLDWLAADLASVERGRTVVVFVHIPAYCTIHTRHGETKPNDRHVITNRDLLYRLLEPYRSWVICGHMHESEYLRDGGCEVHVVGAVCGAWWTGPICYDGTPRGYGVYEVRGSELTWRYKSTGRAPDHQMTLHAPGKDPGAPGQLVANVWGADDRWRVEWHQDGERRGRMDRRTGLDPEAVALYEGRDLPAGNGWVDPVRTDHLFTATPDPGARELLVEARDPWGRISTASIRL